MPRWCAPCWSREENFFFASKPAVNRGDFFRGGDRVVMQAGGEFWLTVAAASIENGHGDAVFDESAEQDFVAVAKVIGREIHLAVAVVLVIVGAGNPDHEVRREGIERTGKAAEKLVQVHRAFDIAHGFDIERAGTLRLGG